MMNKELIDKIIDIIYIPSEFGICVYDDFLHEEEDYYNLLSKNHIDAEIRFGCTKLVIIPAEGDYVIKIPFNGKWDEAYEGDEYVGDDFLPFYYANDINEEARNWDYCENELCKYEKAVEDGFGKFFPDTQFYGYKVGESTYPIYIQKKIKSCCADMDKTDFKEVSENTSNYYQDHKFDFCCVNKRWILSAIEYYGAEVMRNFCKYLKDHRMHTDLHGGNVGFDNDGTPILIDWAGFRDGD